MSMHDKPHHPFARTAFYLMGGLLIWLACFSAVYIFAAVAIAQDFAGRQLAGFSLVSVFTLVAVAVSAVATALLVRNASARLGDRQLGEHARFIAFVTFVSSIIGLIALIWLVLPVLLVSD